MRDSDPRRRRRLAGMVAVIVAGCGVPAAALRAAPDAAPRFADPSATTTSTTTTSAPLDLAAQTTTTRPAPTTTTTTSTLPGAAVPSTTAVAPTPPPVVAQPPAATTVQPSDVAIASTIPAGEPGDLATDATVPTRPDEPDAVGTWTTDPADWAPAVRELLISQGLDLDALAEQSTAAAGAPGQLLSNEGCAVNCITSGLAHAVGVGVYLEVTTSVPAFIQIEILDVGLKFGPPSAQVWGSTWAHLEPGTTYQAIARAHDAQGNLAVAAGEFTTMTRSARITFTPTVFWFGNLPAFDPFGDHVWQLDATAYLDGQPQASATGEPAVNDEILPTAAALALTLDTGTIDESVIDVAYVGVYHCLAGCEDVSLWDLFVEAIFGAVPPQAVPPMVEHSNGVTPSSFWGTVANGVQLDGYPDDVNSWTGHEFTFPLSTFNGEAVGPPVYLQLEVTVEVVYSPPE